MIHLFFLFSFCISANVTQPNKEEVALVFKGTALTENLCKIDSSYRGGTCYTVEIDSLIYARDSMHDIPIGKCINVYSVFHPYYNIIEVTPDCVLEEESYYFLTYNNDDDREGMKSYRFLTSTIIVNSKYTYVKKTRGYVPDFIPYATGFGRTFKDKKELETYIMEDLIGKK